MNVLGELRQRFAVTLASVAKDMDPSAAEKMTELVLPSQDAKFGDYQANCAMPLGKRLGMPPREVAQQLIDRLAIDDLCESPTIAGPGFINLRLRDSWIAEAIERALADGQRLGVRPIEHPRTYLIDFSSPNVAKPMHVGHIRSTVIGDALCRVLGFLGHKTISDNHIGDWGTQFGMILYGYKHFVDQWAFEKDPVAELSRLYKLVQRLVKTQKLEAVQQDPELAALADAHPDIQRAALAETAALHGGDATNRQLWNRFLPLCLAEIDGMYKRLGVSFDHTLGESHYQDKLANVVADLKSRGLARESDGAVCLFLDGFDAPMIVQKQDGAFLYATTDLATIQYRMERWSPDAILYVVDHRQALHFEQLFATVRLWEYPDVELQHIRFGTVLGEDGRPYKTRSGTTVGLSGLLDEAVERAHKIVCENDDSRPTPQLSQADRKTVADRIGIGAIKYADLAHNRTSDYEFSYDKMLAMTGNTAAYMQYSYARVRSIFMRGGIDPNALAAGEEPVLLESPQERNLALTLLQLGEALERVAEDYRPNHLTNYLFNLASRYSEFFEQCPVLKAQDDRFRDSRLMLCELTARTIRKGLNLLGIEVVERM